LSCEMGALESCTMDHLHKLTIRVSRRRVRMSEGVDNYTKLYTHIRVRVEPSTDRSPQMFAHKMAQQNNHGLLFLDSNHRI